MVSTSFTAAAMVALSAGSVPTAPNWHKDYSSGMAAAVAQQKPMAVFIGQGEAGYAKIVAGGQIPAEVGQLLSSRYVSVYVNTETPVGQALAGQFEMQAGLVISSRGGAKQALRLPGTVNGTQLTGVLSRHGSTTPVSTTGVVVSAAPAVGYAAPASYAVPSALPATYAAPVAYRAPAASFASPAMTYPAPVRSYAPAYSAAPSFAPSYPSYSSAPAYSPAPSYSAAPSYSSAPSYAPAYAPASVAPQTMSVGGGCANGRCGLR